MDYSNPPKTITDAEMIAMCRDPNRRKAMIAVWGPKDWPERGSIPHGETRRGDHAVLTSYTLDGDVWRLESRD